MLHLLSEPWGGAAYQLVCLFPVCSQVQIVRAVQIVLLCVNSFYVLSTVSACEENAENTRWTPWGWGNPKAVTYGQCRPNCDWGCRQAFRHRR